MIEGKNDFISIFWFRRDLRLNDNAGLYHALKASKQVLPIFIFDLNILDELPRDDARVTFIHDQLTFLKQELESFGSTLYVYHGKPVDIWAKILDENKVDAVYTNHDYEPYALQREAAVTNLLSAKNISFHSYKDHVIFEKDEVLKDDGAPYTVFTPYKRKWLAKLESKLQNGTSFYLNPYPSLSYADAFFKTKNQLFPSLSDIGFERSTLELPLKSISQALIKEYDEKRNFPAIKGTSRLGIHFRFGTISIREKALKAQSLSDTFLSELIWRDFYSMILYHFPKVATQAFKDDYNKIKWVNNSKDLEAWKNGKTGYPIVDAGMRELNATGFMHNRVRMITASFLTKHLLIDWKFGEAYFAEKLLDFDLASNNGGWQWAAGCGTDAAPYFRIFSPDAQQEKFDKQLKYIKKWVPEYDTINYVKPIVDHKEARERCLSTFKAALSS
ncbi:MAG TPA: deoxyribodipyrimidine photo-lyase [Saprospiraceae bacterium]|nr:deoxyribodipyrimidine photo-lyase [Saprospiraceae bacterium]HPN69816.1 deoxyribodipyrimidine photo-lyase [Saprospiraceae bacterium]